MSVKELITVPDDILRKKSEPLNKVDVNEILQKIKKDLCRTCHHVIQTGLLIMIFDPHGGDQILGTF